MTSHIPMDCRALESQAIDEYPTAELVAKDTIQHLKDNEFPALTIVERPLDQCPDGYHLLLVDNDGMEVARVGVKIIDYSTETIH